MNLSKKTNYLHIIFISILATHYFVPLILIGQIVINIHDNLDIGVVYDHVISKIYKGDFEIVNYFLSGEFKWYYIQKLFYPINVLHYFLSDEFFYYTNDILKRIFPYFSFYLLAKSLNVKKFNSALGGILYASIINIHTPLGFALPLLPYVLYLLINKDSLNKKHYLVLFLIGLNSALVEHIFAFIFLLPISIFLRKKIFSPKLYLKVFLIIIGAMVLASSHLVIGTILSEEIIHRVDFATRRDFFEAFLSPFVSLFSFFDYNNFRSIFKIPLSILYVFLIIISLFSKDKNIKLLFYFISFIVVLEIILGSTFIDNFFIGPLSILKGFSFTRVNKILPILFVLIFIFYVSILKNQSLKKLLYILSFSSVISIQLMTPLPEISQYFLSKNMDNIKFNFAKIKISQGHYLQGFKIIFDINNYTNTKNSFEFRSNKTFYKYYKFNDYRVIKSIVENSRVMSVGLDPMIAVMNDIRVIDGYHEIYPKNYKIKFRKIIEKELENNSVLKKYYDNWGARIYAFYSDQNNLMLDFKYAKKLGAKYVISKFLINNDDLEIVCYECNNSNQIFLYEIL